MEAFSALLAICAGNSPVTGEFPTQRPVTRSFDVFFDLHLNKQSWGWRFETPSRSLWRHCNGYKCRAKHAVTRALGFITTGISFFRFLMILIWDLFWSRQLRVLPLWLCLLLLIRVKWTRPLQRFLLIVHSYMYHRHYTWFHERIFSDNTIVQGEAQSLARLKLIIRNSHSHRPLRDKKLFFSLEWRHMSTNNVTSLATWLHVQPDNKENIKVPRCSIVKRIPSQRVTSIF